MNQKWMMCASVAVLLLAAGPAQAQFGRMTEAARINAARLNRFTARQVTQATRPIVPAVRVPKGVLPNGAAFVNVQIPKLPKVGNKVNASYLYRHQSVLAKAKQQGMHLTDTEAQEIMAHAWFAGTEDGGAAVGKAFYEDQASLAQDLNTFYEGSGIEVEVGGELAKLYALPADGIVYKPAGYSEPVVLLAEEDFVIYYPRTKTGQLVKNTPEMVEFFGSREGTSSGLDELVSLGGEIFYMPSGEPDFDFIDGIKKGEEPAAPAAGQPVADAEMMDFIDVESEPLAPLSPREEFQRSVAEMRLRNAYEADWKQSGGVKRYTNQDQLGRDLSVFYQNDAPQVYNRFSRVNFYVYELPVEGIEYAPEGNPNVRTLSPSDYVVIYHDKIGGQIVERETLDNPLFFQDIPAR